jgi:hypothetical protein
MACPNFKNGQKNGLGPLGAKFLAFLIEEQGFD